MIEIAIALAVIGFAVVAIIGVLPTGIQIQKGNREETIAGQDGALWFDAIRGGVEGMFDLENFVDGGIEVGGGPPVGWVDGRDIIGLLSTPGTNRALVRSIGGVAADRGTPVGFRYWLEVRNWPFQSVNGPSPAGAFTNALGEWQLLLHDLTVELKWPVYPDGTAGAERRTFRSLVSGRLIEETNAAGTGPVYFFRE